MATLLPRQCLRVRKKQPISLRPRFIYNMYSITAYRVRQTILVLFVARKSRTAALGGIASGIERAKSTDAGLYARTIDR